MEVLLSIDAAAVVTQDATRTRGASPRLLGSHRPGDSGLSRAQIAGAVPPGSRRPRSQDRYLKVLLADEDLDRLRADYRAHVLEFARIHVRYAHWLDMTSRPTRARVCELAGFGVTTYKKCRRWLEKHGYLGLVEPGSTPEFRPMALCHSPDDRNTAAVYVLAVPAAREKQLQRLVRKTRELTRPPSAISQMRDLSTSREKTETGNADLSPLRRGPLKNLSDRALAACCRPFLAAGWTVADVQHATDHRFGGEPWRFSLSKIRRPAGWFRWRLKHWTGASGQPLPSRSQQLEASSRQRRAEQDTRRRDQAAAAAAAADPRPWAARIRAQHGWRQDQLDLGLSP